MGTLYLTSTPIGNLEDITIRALKTLWSVDTVFCEDTRETQKILAEYQNFRIDSSPKLISLTDFNELQRVGEVLDLLRKDKDIALVSDRGTPIISDPGYKLVRGVIKEQTKNPQIKVTALPGANAILPALLLSGLPPDKFIFVGFLPKKRSARINFLKNLPHITIVAFEAPHRLMKTLADLYQLFPECRIGLIRELTKIHEEVFRGQISEAISHFSSHIVKGEITLVFRP